MASETNELTFVRCPTCRSLVPASAARCRICNATLEAGGKPAASEPPAPQGRARQKTVSAAAEEVRSMVTGAPPAEPVSKPATPAPAQQEAAPVAAASNSASDDEAFDPLGAFLQDLDAEEPKSAAGAPPVSEKIEPPVTSRFEDDSDDEDDEEDDEDDFDLDIFDDPAFDELLRDDDPEPTSKVAESNADGESDISDDFEDLLEDPVDSEEPAVEVQPEVKPEAPAPPRRERPIQEPPRQVAPREAAPREEVSRPRASEPAGRESKAARPVDKQPEPRSRVETPAPARPPRPQIGGAAPRPEIKPRVNPEPVGRERVASQPQRPPQQETRRVEQREAPSRVEQPVREERVTNASSGPRTNKMKPGRLFGWLVSYENPDGRAIELRVGRFFITGSSIRGSDLILEDQSISTPHALVAITENGFQLQDLMSERGTFVRQQGEAQYTREDGVVEIRHGDWIRFGDVEFLVTIVPS